MRWLVGIFFMMHGLGYTIGFLADAVVLGGLLTTWGRDVADRL